MNSRNIVIYCRSSSQETQKRQLNSIPAQITKLHEWAKSSNAVIISEFQDMDTGTDFNRPGFQKMWRYVKENHKRITHVVCADVTRFGREGSEFLTWFKKFKTLGVEVNFVDQWFDFSVPETWSIFYFMIGAAEAESRRISQRTMTIKKHIRTMGYYADTPPAPWQYGPRDENGRKPLIAKDPAFSTYKKAIQYFLGGLNQSDAIEMAAKSGYRIKRSTFSRIIRNPLLAGFIPIYSGSRLVDTVQGKVEPMITWYDYQKLQSKLHKEKLNEESKKAYQSFNSDFPYKQILQCPVCEGSVRAYFATGRHGGKFGYYDCGRHYRISSKAADAMIVEVLNLFSVNQDEQDIVNAAAAKAMAILGMSTSKRIEQLSKERSVIDARIAKLKSDYSVLDPETFNDMMEEAKAVRSSILARIDNVKATEVIAADTKVRLVGLLNNFGDWWVDATPYQKYETLRMVFPAGFRIETNQCRTPRINQVLSLICSLSSVYRIDPVSKAGKPILFLEADASGSDIEPDLYLVRRFLASIEVA